MAEQVPAVCDVLATIKSPAAVIACLSGDPPPSPPAYHKVRDGLIVRWIDIPG